MKKILFGSALLFAALCTASTKQYTVTFVTPVQVGAVKLAAGEYKVKVEGSQAVFTDAQSKSSVTVPVKIENSDKKFNNTAVETNNQNGATNIQAIELGGSNTRLTLGQ